MYVQESLDLILNADFGQTIGGNLEQCGDH
jgi:hypothetical protein